MGVRDSSGLENVRRVVRMKEERKKRRRPPRKLMRQLTAEELMAEAEFRRWKYHSPASMKRQAYELVNR